MAIEKEKMNWHSMHWTEIRMIRCMCGVYLTDKLSCAELRQRLGIRAIGKVVQTNRLRKLFIAIHVQEDYL